jgi:site-specific recombinase XerD
MRTKLDLPLTTRRFLRTPRGRRARTAVHALHRWLDRRQLALEQLTPQMFQTFLRWPQRARVTPKSSQAYWTRLRDYLYWLGERGLIRFNPKHLRRHLKLLPPLAREFLALLAPTHRPSTCGGYASALRSYYGWLDKRELDPRQLTRREIVSWFQELHAAGLSDVTRHGLLIQIRVYLRWLSERAGMRTAPDDLVRPADLPKLPLYLPRPLTTEADRELQRRLAASQDARAWALLLMRRTGLRISELCGLEFHCTRLDDRRPLLKVPLGKMNNERLVPLDSDAVDVIRRLQSVGPRPRSWLVPGRGGRKMDYWRLHDVLDVAGRGLPDPARITSHRLRHTYATELISAGMSLVGVMRLLGHRDHRMTLRYAAITPETIGDEYQKALAQLATKYQLPPPAIRPERDDATDPDQILEHLSRWVRKHATSREAPRALLRRIERLQRDVRSLKASIKK